MFIFSIQNKHAYSEIYFGQNMHVTISTSTVYLIFVFQGDLEFSEFYESPSVTKILVEKFFVVVICLTLWSLKQQKSACSRHSTDVECIVTWLPPYVYIKPASRRRYGNVGNVHGNLPTPLFRVEALAHSVSTVIHWPGSSSLCLAVSDYFILYMGYFPTQAALALNSYLCDKRPAPNNPMICNAHN
jgi:hypothetical protein